MSEVSSQKAVIYCRVSSKRQTIEGSGLDSQEHRCRQYAKTKGYDVLEVFGDDVSGGGDFMKRQGMVQLLDFLALHTNDNVIVIFDDLKRFARDTIFHFKLKQTLQLYNAKPECLNFKFEDTPEGEFVETVFAAQGQLERLQNRRQTVQKMRARLEQGYWVFAAPMGYKYAKHAAHGKLLVRDEPVASIIQEALEGLAAGRFQSIAEVKRFFETFPTFPRDMYGDVRYQRVTEIATRPVYAGCVSCDKWDMNIRQGQHEGLISYEDFQKVQQRLTEKPQAPARPDLNRDFPLRGFVTCGECERPLTACWSKSSTGKRHAYYLCQYKHCSFRGKSIRRDAMEGDFADMLKELQPSQSGMRAAAMMFKDLWDRKAAMSTQLVKSMKQDLITVETQIQTLLDRIMNASSTSVVGAYENRIGQLEQKKLELTQKCAQNGQPTRPFEEMFERAMLFLANPCKIWENGGLEYKRNAARLPIPPRPHIKVRAI